MFDFNEVEGNSAGSKRIKPGVHEVKVTGFEVVADTGSIKMTFVNNEGEEHVEYMSMSEKAKVYTMRKLKHMGTKLTEEDNFNKLTTPNHLEKFFVGKDIRIKFDGVEREKDGTVYLNAQIGLPNFAESVNSETSLNPTPNIKKLIRSEDVSINDLPTSSVSDEDDDLPF